MMIITEVITTSRNAKSPKRANADNWDKRKVQTSSSVPSLMTDNLYLKRILRQNDFLFRFLPFSLILYHPFIHSDRADLPVPIPAGFSPPD